MPANAKRARVALQESKDDAKANKSNTLHNSYLLNTVKYSVEADKLRRIAELSKSDVDGTEEKTVFWA